MKQITATIMYPVTISMVIDENRLDDDDYIEKIKDLLIEQADYVLQTSTIRPFIHYCDAAELID